MTTRIDILSFPAIQGNVTVTQGSVIGEPGRTVTVTATPAQGYRFVRWEVTTTPPDQPPSSQCVPGRFVRDFCDERALVGVYETGNQLPNGECETVQRTIEVNATRCQPCASAGTLLGTYCTEDIFTLWEIVADGRCGETRRIREVLSPLCGYTVRQCPTVFTTIPEQSFCDGTTYVETYYTGFLNSTRVNGFVESDGQCATATRRIPNAPQCQPDQPSNGGDGGGGGGTEQGGESLD
jgi:hypothetical protein